MRKPKSKEYVVCGFIYVKLMNNITREMETDQWLPGFSDRCVQKGVTQSSLVEMALFWILVVVVVTQGYTCGKTARGHTHKQI